MGFIVLAHFLQANLTERAFEVFQQILEGPFTSEEHSFVTQNIGKFAEQFGGTTYEETANALVMQTLQIAPDKFVSPPSDKLFPVIDDEW